MSGLHFAIEDLAPPTTHRGIAKGDIVTFAWQRKRIYGWVLSWSGDLDKTCRLIDLRFQIHNRFADSLTRETDAEELAILEPRFHELLQSKKGKSAVQTPVQSDWAGYGGQGVPQRCDIPYVLRDRLHAGWPSGGLISYCSGPSDRLLLHNAQSAANPLYVRSLEREMDESPRLHRALRAA